MKQHVFVWPLCKQYIWENDWHCSENQISRSTHVWISIYGNYRRISCLPFGYFVAIRENKISKQKSIQSESSMSESCYSKYFPKFTKKLWAITEKKKNKTNRLNLARRILGSKHRDSMKATFLPPIFFSTFLELWSVYYLFASSSSFKRSNVLTLIHAIAWLIQFQFQFHSNG